jgi:hypothetical protein
MYKTIDSKVFRVLMACIFFSIISISANGGPATVERIIPRGKVFVLEDGKKVGQFNREAPLPKGVSLKCDSECSIKLKDLYLVGLSQTLFSFPNVKSGRILSIESGTIGFAIRSLNGRFVISTEAGNFTIHQAIINASTENRLLKGFINAGPRQSSIMVVEGGSLIVSTADGERTIKTGDRLQLAQNTTTSTDTSEDDDKISAMWWVVGGVVLTALATGLAASSHGGSSTVIPSPPPTETDPMPQRPKPTPESPNPPPTRKPPPDCIPNQIECKPDPKCEKIGCFPDPKCEEPASPSKPCPIICAAPCLPICTPIPCP